MITKNCLQCGKEKSIPNWREKYGFVKFCSMDCYRKYRITHLEYHQPFHQKKLDTHPVLTKSLLREKYLTKKMKMADIASELSYGYATVNYWIRKYKLPTRIQRDYSRRESYGTIRKDILKNRGNKCEICGWTEASCDVHHKTPRVNGGSHKHDNLIILCPNHHRMVEEGQLKI